MGRNARYRSAEIKAGIWIFIGLLLAASFLIGITGAKFWKDLDHYRVRLDYIGGLEVGSPVRMGGMVVGKISGVKLLPEGSQIELTLEVKKGLPIKSNTLAYLSFVSITSEQHLELNPGEAQSPLLSPGDLIQSKEMIEMADVLAKFDLVADTVQVILHEVSLMFNPTNVARVDSILHQVNYVFDVASPRIKEVLTNLTRATAVLDSMLNNINGFVQGADTSFQRLVGDSRGLIAQANSTLARVDSTVGDMDLLMDANSTDLIKVFDNLKQASYNLRVLSNSVKDNPFLLFRVVPKKERDLPKQ